MLYTLQEGEKKLGSWTINYIAPGGGRYLGQLDVTDRNLYYDGKFDMSFSGVVQEALFVKKGSEGYLCIPKSLIKTVDVKKSMLKKQVLVTLEDGQVHTFDYGAMSVDKLFASIKQLQ